MLLAATVGIAWMSELLVGSIQPAAASLGLGSAFVGVFVVAILGNAAEHATAITVALKNRMDLALSIAIGSSIQVARFVAPVLVLASLAIGPRPMDLVLPGGLIRTALAEIDKPAGRAFVALDRERREALINDWYAAGGAAAAALGRVVLSAYDRDDRVLRALGHEARAPFPQGHVVGQGDWGLLDPVKRPAPFWRDDRNGSGGR